ncbi:MAG: PIG-L family deacetylase [Candidatus Ozemobacteraceae bacterium]
MFCFLFFFILSGSSAEKSFAKEAEKGLTNAKRILFFAPHPDDEVICLGGYLADSIASGTEVSVAVVSDGAVFTKALRARQPKPSLFFRAHDYRTLGHIRRTESARALDDLGIPPRKCFFLGYPSESLLALFTNPRASALVRCYATAQRYGVADWGGTRRKPHPYSRAMLISDLDHLLEQVNPDVVVIPHPDDSNTDHQAVSRFILERMAYLKRPTRTIAYLVHQGSRRIFPKPFGYHPEAGIDSPVGFPTPFRFLPTAAAQAKKEKAVRRHRSQIRLKDGFLLSFLRREELFWIIPPGYRPDAPKTSSETADLQDY